MPAIELEFGSDAVEILRRYGFAELQYITAQFEPFSSAQRPDLFFSPYSGPNQGCLYLAELRMPLELESLTTSCRYSS